MKRWAVIFDMDGVLIDSYKAHFLSWKRMLKRYGLEMSEEEFSSTFGQTNRDILSRIFPDLKEEEYEKMANQKEEIFRQIIEEDFPEMEGASELIEEIHKAGGLLGIGSSGPFENIKTVLRKLPAGRYFSAIVSGSEIKKGKPDPEVFLKVAEKLKILPSRCIVIEDSPAGVKAGKRAGCSVVALTGTVSKEYLMEADLIVDSLKELNPEILQKLLKC